MTNSDAIVAGAFTIEAVEPELREALAMAMGVEASLADHDHHGAVEPIMAPPFVDVRRLVIEDEDDHPMLFAMALDTPTETVWLVRGEVPLALVPVKDKHKDNPKKRLHALADWAGALSPIAAEALAWAGYPSADDDDSLHMVVDLPLDGIDTHRADGLDLDEWLDALTDAAETFLEEADVEAEVVMFDSSDESRSAISGHIAVFVDDEAQAKDLVTQALMAAFAAFTPRDAVVSALSVDLEDECMYDIYGDLMESLDDHDGQPDA
ncbi:MAG: hypothetical protein FWD75_05610 [Propionibacteriaceae bacterium]|nr:hypothetical protein [Propionibacteriaceae bacterium]